MKRAFWLASFVVAVALVGIASADSPPAAPVEEAIVAPAPPAAPATVAEEAPAVDLVQIFGLPGETMNPAGPEKKWSACTLFQCRQGCGQPGCFSYCIDTQTCECGVICN